MQFSKYLYLIRLYVINKSALGSLGTVTFVISAAALMESFFFSSLVVPVDLSPEERSELEDIRRRKGVLLQEIQRLREELREAILEVEGLETSTEGR